MAILRVTSTTIMSLAFKFSWEVTQTMILMKEFLVEDYLCFKMYIFSDQTILLYANE